ncbi:hypothetical protein [Emticicia fluvialis]|uniref:hypothetical protein n=1 Tax=Emticicia fluvialis TaxID=2974474 RepID=UPI0021663CE0|nr:hypothetical protein [Emticicia fluvialis]
MTKSRFIATLALFFVASAGFAQSIDDIPLKDLKAEYMTITGFNRVPQTRMVIDFDYGQKSRVIDPKQAVVRDENDKKIKFESMVDALNFMSRNGYDFVQAYAFTLGEQGVQHYLLRKRKPSANNQ